MTKKFAEYNRVNQWDLPVIVNPERTCVQFEIPDEQYHIRAFWTALYKLTLWNSWDADDAHTGREAAQVWRQVLNEAMENPETIGCIEPEEYPTPYWDDDTSVDDEAPADEQDWYGYVEDALAPANEITFVQNAVIWILTGFVALVLSPTLPVGAAAAVTFRTLAKRFTLAFNRGDIVEQFRVIIDAKDYGTVDTAGMAVGDVVELSVDGLDDLSFHDIVIVVTQT